MFNAWNSEPAPIATPITVTVEGVATSFANGAEALDFATASNKVAVATDANGRELYTLAPWTGPVAKLA